MVEMVERPQMRAGVEGAVMKAGVGVARMNECESQRRSVKRKSKNMSGRSRERQK